LCQEAVQLARSKLGAEHFITFRLAGDLGCGYRQAGDLEQALALHEQTAASAKATLGPDHPGTLLALDNLGWDYLEAGRLDLARSAFEEALKFQRTKLGPEHPDTLTTLAALVECLLRQGNYNNAEPMARECLDLRRKTTPKQWRTFAAQSFLGMTLLGQNKYADAEPFLLAGYAGLKEKQSQTPAGSRVFSQTVQALMQLYDAWGKPDEVARWKREMEKRP
jgi:tetratricopeptide (TPR) repeat protein